MTKQERVGKLFNFFVVLVGAGRFTRQQIPLFGLVCVTALGFGISHEPTVALLTQTASDVRMAASFAAEKAGSVSLAEKIAPGGGRKTELALSRQQSNIAKYISAQYRVELDRAKSYVDLAFKIAKSYKVDPHLVLAVMSIESSFVPDAQSHKGAQGLMQVLTRVHKEKFAPFGGIEAAYDPESNIKVGVQILRDYLVRGGSEEQALKFYVGAALLDDDGGYGLKVLTQKERLMAAAQGKNLPQNAYVVASTLVPSLVPSLVSVVKKFEGDVVSAGELKIEPVSATDKEPKSELSVKPEAVTRPEVLVAEKATDI